MRFNIKNACNPVGDGDDGFHENCVAQEFSDIEYWSIQMFLDWSIPTITAMFRQDAARQVGFPVGFSRYEDPLFFLQLCSLGCFAKVHLQLAGYRARPGQLTAGSNQYLLSLTERMRWLSMNPDFFTAEEQEKIRQTLTEILGGCIESYASSRQWGLVREAMGTACQRAKSGSPSASSLSLASLVGVRRELGNRIQERMQVCTANP